MQVKDLIEKLQKCNPLSVVTVIVESSKDQDEIIDVCDHSKMKEVFITVNQKYKLKN